VDWMDETASELARHVPDGRVLDLLRQYVRRTIYYGGLYEDVERDLPGLPGLATHGGALPQAAE
jgi:hypothetical protein